MGDGALDRHVVEQIERDLPRTFPRHTMWRASVRRAAAAAERRRRRKRRKRGGGGAADAAVRGCLVRALLDSEVLYVQAMNYVVGALLMYQTEEVAFWTFTQLMWGVGLRRCFLQGLPLVMSCLDALGENQRHPARHARRIPHSTLITAPCASSRCLGCTSTLRRRA